MPATCEYCNLNKAKILRPKNRKKVCLPCFYEVFENEIHLTIIENKIFKKGEKIAMGASGGKDSTVLIHVMKTLNDKYDYGLNLFLLSIDEGITGYRDDSLETVKKNRDTYGLPLTILSYKDLYDWTMDEVVKQIGLNNNCTYCGVFRRQALEKGAKQMGADKILTGHNADDIAETVLMNLLRGDAVRLAQCVDVVTGKKSAIPRAKPFKYTYEKEIVMYAYHKKLDYFATECVYSPNAYRGHARELIKNIESIRPSAIIDIIHSAESLAKGSRARKMEKKECKICGFMTSKDICQACVLVGKLNDMGKPKIEIGYETEEMTEN